jgi:putative ABC transport system permease protein
MNIFKISLAYLKHKKLSSLLNVVLLALGSAVIFVLITFSGALNKRLSADASNIDMVVGAKGSPLQLILSSVYHADVPIGNIELEDANKIAQKNFVKTAIPLALGDSYKGARIVGTTPEYIAHYGAKLSAGKLFADEMQVVVGSNTGLAFGNKFAGSHGLEAGGEVHAEFEYEVVGVLAPTGTVLDRLILTPLESVWHIHSEHNHEAHEDHDKHGHDEHKHEEHDHDDHAKYELEHKEHNEHEADKEITALLVQFKNPVAGLNAMRAINKDTQMQAASPAYESARLFSVLGFGLEGAKVFGFIILLSAIIGLFVALLTAMDERRYDVAIMRSLGSKKAYLITQIVVEGQIITWLGLALAYILSVFAINYAASLPDFANLALGSFSLELAHHMVIAAVVVAAIIASIIPALKVLKIDVSKTLSNPKI